MNETKISMKHRVEERKLRSVPFVSTDEVVLGLILLRGALVRESEGLSRPLTDEYTNLCLADTEHFRQAWDVVCFHFNRPDIATPAMNRLRSFVLLLREVNAHPNRRWRQFTAEWDRFLPILYAVAWTEVTQESPFDQNRFMRMAERSPQVRVSAAHC